MKAALIFSIAATTIQVHATDPKPPMTRIEYRNISAEIQPNSFAAKPKVLYIAGNTYSRTEEQPDPPLGLHELIICNEPDVWMVNLIPHTGLHIIDPGPTFVTHHNILDLNAPKEFSSLEFGKEVDFFLTHHAAQLNQQSLDGQHCEVSEYRHASYRIVLFIRSDTHQPFHVDIYLDGKHYFAIRYLSYLTDLPFNPELFKPPTGIAITEAKPGNHK